MKAGMCGSFNVRSHQNNDNNSNNNLLNFYRANINIKVFICALQYRYISIYELKILHTRLKYDNN